MHQKTEIVAEIDHLENDTHFVGGGVGDDHQYTTWELKECPVCKRLCLEHYSAITVENIVEAEYIVRHLSKAINNSEFGTLG